MMAGERLVQHLHPGVEISGRFEVFPTGSGDKKHRHQVMDAQETGQLHPVQLGFKMKIQDSSIRQVTAAQGKGGGSIMCSENPAACKFQLDPEVAGDDGFVFDEENESWLHGGAR